MQVLFNNDTELKSCLPSITKGFKLELIEADIETALRRFILPYLSVTQYDASIGSTNETHKSLMTLVKKAAVYIAFYLYLPEGKVIISDGGISYSTEKSKQASAEDKDELRISMSEKGFQYIEDMLQYLEANKSTFTAWAGSASYTLYTSLLIRNADEFRIIEGRRTVFLKLIPYIEDIETERIAKLFPASFIASLKTLTGLNATKLTLLRSYIRPIVANLALERGLSAMAVKFQNGTISVFDNSSANQSKGFRAASTEALKSYRADLLRTAEKRIADMADFVNENRTDLGLETPTVAKTEVYRNLDENKTKFF